MLITEEIFHAFLKCETKSHLKFSGAVGFQCELDDWQRNLVEDFKWKCCTQLRSNFREDECLAGTLLSQVLGNKKYYFVIDCMVHTSEIQSHIHALERLTSPDKIRHSPYIPIRFVPSEKITKHDKLLLAFDALALSMASGKMPPFGKIIHGSKQTTVKVQLAVLMKTTQSIVERIIAQQASHVPPPLILNKHCAECEFQTRCRQIAKEKDELSLLSSMTEKERKKHHNKGIFSITQLSYTFRPRRKPKRFASRMDKYLHALKALSIRENKIHITGRPGLNIKGRPVYLDVEGIPDQDFYYLIGLRIKSGDSYVQQSFWANDLAEEKEIWTSFLQSLSKIENPQIIYYGSYETVFLKRMKDRYNETVENPAFLDQIISESINLLSVIYAQIYFPTYSNGLKEVAQYLGFQWSDNYSSGLNAMIWRYKWERSKDSILKQKLVTYNAEDCEAVERVANVIAHLCRRQTEAARPSDNNIIYTDSMKRESLYRFGNNIFSIPELQHINQAAYWDYQRESIYVRSSQRLKHISRKVSKSITKTLPINKIIQFPPPDCCPKCGAQKIMKRERMSKVVHDLKFGRAGIKRWIVKYFFNRYFCFQCKFSFLSQQRPWTASKFGAALSAYVIYQVIDLQIPQNTVVQNLNQLFGFHLDRSSINRRKSRAAQWYKDTYNGIFDNIVNGRLIHADETKISIGGKNEFIWVLTNLEEVVYLYTETREGDFLQRLLQGFNGVLVSDFYTAYDSINCPQQKCLIHLMRDLNDDLLHQPFNEELKELIQEFAMLLKPMIETIDRFGLKAHFLRKHRVFVDRFYKILSKRKYTTEAAVKNKKRFERNHDKLFTFLDYDGVPWNNNNAEHAIKAFAKLRKVIGGISTNKGIRDYLILLSIRETCKYKGLNFLDFLRSGEKDIDLFIQKNNRVSNSKL